MKRNSANAPTRKSALEFPSKAQSWRDIFEFLESINSNDPNRVGRLFELFCKHYFIACPHARDYRSVWAGDEIPLRVKAKLGLATRDHGYDLVLETVDEKLAVVQCKFTADQNKTKLGWTKHRLSSWLAASSRADIRILFTNASAIDHETQRKAGEKAFFEFSLSHLEKLSSAEIGAIAK